jgi:hypothetical protein
MFISFVMQAIRSVQASIQALFGFGAGTACTFTGHPEEVRLCKVILGGAQQVLQSMDWLCTAAEFSGEGAQGPALKYPRAASTLTAETEQWEKEFGDWCPGCCTYKKTRASVRVSHPKSEGYVCSRV